MAARWWSCAGVAGAYVDTGGGEASGVVGFAEGVKWLAYFAVDGQVLQSGAQVGVVSQAYDEREGGQGVGVEQPCGVDELDAEGIGKLGLRIAIYPGLERAAAGYAIREALGTLKKEGNTRSLRGRMLSLKEYNDALKLDEIEAWEKQYLR